MKAERKRECDGGDPTEAELFAWLDISAANDRESAAMRELLLLILFEAEAQCGRHEVTMRATT
jgi:hypothetical protein